MHLSRRPSVGLGALVLLAAGTAQANYNYSLDVTYDRTNFFRSFDFFTGEDPTRGYVEYVNHATAQQEGLVGYGHKNKSVVLGVDHKTVQPAKGRRSVRLTSKKSFTRGLFIADIAHMPASACGVWPAHWMFGPEWPTSGEIDIIEGVGTQTQNLVTLHTAAGCAMNNTGSLPSTFLKSASCGQNVGEGATSSSGCSQQTADKSNYGDGFNAIGGGVYATEWTSDHIAVWFFPRSAIPRDIANNRPNPAAWGRPTARFLGGGGGGCDVDTHFANHQLVFNIDFCGDWAGNADVWRADAKCSAKAATCKDYVANNPTAFEGAFWDINSVKVFQVRQPGTGNRTAGISRRWRA